ncbi:MAG: hypothetical protein HC837_02130 [Chloroflexaceae bacterium]|nr:hypothetical protein [Chloroflexaceae bacterium]
MTQLVLPRKWLVRAHGQDIVLARRSNERPGHVIMKALLWALYLPAYPAMTVERAIGDRYKPDVVALDEQNQPRFWGEAGQVSSTKLRSLLRRYPSTHLALARWQGHLELMTTLVQQNLDQHPRTAPVDLLLFPADSIERFIDHQGYITITHTDLEWVRIAS